MSKFTHTFSRYHTLCSTNPSVNSAREIPNTHVGYKPPGENFNHNAIATERSDKQREI